MPCSYCRETGHTIVTCIAKQQDLVEEQEKLIGNLSAALSLATKQMEDMKARHKVLTDKSTKDQKVDWIQVTEPVEDGR